MSFEFDAPEKLDSDPNFLTEPGTYHFAVLSVDEQPTKKSGQPIDGFRVHCVVLEGTTPGQIKKETDRFLFLSPRMSDRDNGEFAKRKIARFAIATCIMPESTPGQRVTIDLQQACGRQFIAEVETDAYTDDKGNERKSIQLAWANIWHIDDPATAQVPKDAAALALLTATLRKKPEDFQKPKPAAGGNGNGNTKQQAAAPLQPAVNLDDL